MHHDNTETPKTLNNQKKFKCTSKETFKIEIKIKVKIMIHTQNTKKIVDASENVDTSLETSIDTSQNLKESELSTHRNNGNRSL